MPSASDATLWGVSMAGTVTSILQNASGLPMLRRVREEGDAARFTRVPLLTMTVTTLQIGLYGILLYGYPQGLQLVFGNVVGLCTWFAQFAVLMWFTHGARARAFFAVQYVLALAWGVALPLGVFLAAPAGTPLATRQTVVAVFMQAANISGFLSPVAALREALRDMDLRRTPGSLSWVNLANSALWTAYGFLLGDAWIAVPNALGLAIAGAQVAVLVHIARWRALHPEQAAALAAAREAREEAENKAAGAAAAAAVAAMPEMPETTVGESASCGDSDVSQAANASPLAEAAPASARASALGQVAPAAALARARPLPLAPLLGATVSLALALLALPCPVRGQSTMYPVNPLAVGAPFFGIGAQSTAGSARLLIDYPSVQRDSVLDALFLPQFAASLQHLKVEIGGDAQISCGAEASGMRSANATGAGWATVGYEGWLMAEARRRNPSIALLGLVYAWPSWVNAGGTSPFESPATEANAAKYVVSWLRGMKDGFMLDINYVGLWNEREFSSSYVVTLREALDEAGFAAVKIVASDRSWEPISSDYLSDGALRNATAALSQHYPNCNADGQGSQCVDANAVLAHVETGVPLFSSEDYSCWTDENSAAHWASKVNGNVIGGNISFFSAWYLVTSFYPSIAFYNDGLLRASQPWSGHFELTPFLWSTAHFTQFSAPGWRFVLKGHGSGALAGGGTFVSLVDGLGNLTIVVEAAGSDNLGGWASGNCNGGLNYAPASGLQNASFVLQGAASTLPRSLALWRSRFQRGARAVSTLFERLPDVIVGADGALPQLTIEPDAIYTLSTLPGATKGEPPTAPPSAPFPLPYSDDFEGLPEGRPGRYWSDMMGSFAIAAADGGGSGHVLRQVVVEPPCCNFIQSLGGPLAVSIIGASTWRDTEVSIDVALPAATNGFAFVGVRSLFGTAFFSGALVLPAGVFFVLTASEWRLVLEVVSLCGTGASCPPSTWNPCTPPICVAQGELPLSGRAAASMRVTVGALGGTAWVRINGVAVPGLANVSLPSSYARSGAGFVALGSSFVAVSFDNLAIESTASGGGRGGAQPPPAEGHVLRGMPCGDPAAEPGSRWADVTPGEGLQTTLRLRANSSLCLAASADGLSAVLAACDPGSARQQWAVFAGNASVVNAANGACLAAAPGAFAGSLQAAALGPCTAPRPASLWFSADTGYLHTDAQAPLETVCLGAWPQDF